MSPPFTPIILDSNFAVTADTIIVNGKSNTSNNIQRHTDDTVYDCPSPCFDIREEVENHNPLVRNISKPKKSQKRKTNENGPKVIAFNNSIQETKLPEKIKSSKNKEKITKLLQDNEIKLTINSKQYKINVSNYLKCGNCFKQYKKKSFFYKHLLKKNCKLPDTKKYKLFQNVYGVSSNDIIQKYNDKAKPSTSHSITKAQYSNEVKITISDTNPELFKKNINEINSKTLQLKSAGDTEFRTFVEVARSTTNPAVLNKKLEKFNLKKLHARTVKLGPHFVSPLRASDPVRHLNKAFQFVLDARGQGGRWDELTGGAPQGDDGPYKLIVAYMKAFLVNANTHCYTKCSMLSHVTLKNTDFVNHVLHDASCADLFRWKSRTVDERARRRVRGAVLKIFGGWEADRLEPFLLCRQYEYLKRSGVLELSYADPKRPQFRRVAVPHATDPDFTLLRAFCVTGYSPGYLELLRQSLYSFAVPLLVEVVESCVAAAGVFNEAVVLASVRRLNVAWFQNGSGLYEMSNLYEHRGFDDAHTSVRNQSAEQRRYQTMVDAGTVDVNY